MATPGMAHNDPVSVDSKHYKVEFENERVRVLRIKYGPHEKSAMHSHPPSVLFCVTDFHGHFTFPDGRTEERRAKAGETVYFKAEEHLPENLSNKPLEVVQVELKR